MEKVDSSAMGAAHHPLVTYSGDQTVYQSVAASMQKGIGSEAVEWKRAYGRTTKLVHLHPKFIPLDPAAAVNSNATNGNEIGEPGPLTSLLDQSMLHIYWTDCPDVDVYRSTTKDQIQSWLNIVKGCNVREWLIVLVETPDNKKTKQLLPRSSVLDKIKNDFAQKQTERCICLADPTKFDSKSTESLHAMLHRIRQLLLASYSKTLTKFEENMRAQREKRTEAGWNFCHYFLLQEELAFVLEMLGVYDEALVQYDELDALFTQFVLNSHLTDTPKWLLSFQRFGDRWPAVNLSLSTSNAILSYIRETIQNSTVSLLNFRNYLFARQARLLIKQARVNELAQRSLSFLHNCINELNILDVTFSEEGAISCWVFVSCLEILSTISGHGQGTLVTAAVGEKGNQANNTPNSDNQKKVTNSLEAHNPLISAADFSVHTANLWDYAREKLYDLGKLGGLLPKSQPKSDHLHKVISLAAGLSCIDCELEIEKPLVTVNGKTEQQLGNDTEDKDTPINKLKNALASKEQFEHHYMELCELAMGTYKHIGRIRSARKVGLSIAAYYMEAEDYVKAVGFFLDALKTFKEDKWDLLGLDVMLRLADCFKITEDHEKYIRICMQLSCYKLLSKERREKFFDELTNTITSTKIDQPLLASMDELLIMPTVSITTPGKVNNNVCPVTLVIELISYMPKSMFKCSVQAAIVLCDRTEHATSFTSFSPVVASNNSPSGTSQSRGANSSPAATLVKKPSFEHKGGNNRYSPAPPVGKPVIHPGTCEEEDMNLCISEASTTMMKLQMKQYLETKQDRTIHGSRLLCHTSHQALRRKDSQIKNNENNVTKTDFSLSALGNEIDIHPGLNRITLSAQVTNPGMYRVAQICVQYKTIELLSPRMGCRYKFLVDKEPGKIDIIQDADNMNLIAGIEQTVTIRIFTGSCSIPEGTSLSIRSSLGLLLKVGPDFPLRPEISLPLPAHGSFSSFEVQIIVKADLGPQKDNSVIEHKLIARSPWAAEETKLPVVFVPPFMSSHKLHTVGRRKFLQISMHGLCYTQFALSSHQLTVQSDYADSIPLIPLNPRSQELVLTNGHTASFMWEIGTNEIKDEDSTVRLEFSLAFRKLITLTKHSNEVPEAAQSLSESEHHEGGVELYKYYVCLQRFKTYYEIQAKVEPHKGSEFCRVGNMCTMVIEIEKLDKENVPCVSLMYEVRADQHMWAICGRTSGVASMEACSTQQMTIDVMPMSPGYLPLPTVHLSKYIPADPKSGNSSVPKLEPFGTGQVFNKCRGTQVHVLPPPQPPGNAQTIVPSAGGSNSIGFYSPPSLTSDQS